jgi:DNA-binding transcriptional ArsR family regulator
MDTNTDDGLTPLDLLEQYHGDEFVAEYGDKSAFRQLFTPETRTLVLDVLVSERGDALTAQEIADQHLNLSVTGVNRHRDALLALGVIVEDGERGNAMTYALAREHPVAQVLAMLDDLLMWGETRPALDSQFVTDAEQPSAISEWAE